MSFLHDLETDTVGSLPIRSAIIVKPYTLIRAAVALMRTHALGCAVIADHTSVPSGVFTEHSVIEALTKDACFDDTPVFRFADPKFVVVRKSEPILRVWEAVQKAEARFVCVTDDSGKVIGVTGQRGLAEYVADCYAGQITVQRLGSTPWMQQREGA